MAERRLSSAGKPEKKLVVDAYPRKSDFTKSHKVAPGERIEFEDSQGNINELRPPSTVPKKDPKEKNKTLMVVKNLLKENLHISNRDDADIDQLMQKDQIKSVQENAVDDAYA